MSVVDLGSRELPSLNTVGKFHKTSQVRPHTAVSKSDSLEDGEIVEGRISAISSPPVSQQSGDVPQLRSFDQPPMQPSSSTAEHVGSFAPTFVEPMNEKDLDRAKSLVLDLLGWGVSPEYLVECGLSPGVIYRIFTDLRLRLPSNLQVPPSPHLDAR